MQISKIKQRTIYFYFLGSTRINLGLRIFTKKNQDNIILIKNCLIVC